MNRLHDALVIGAGPAGSSVAHRLAQAGRDVVLVEREAGPHDKVCGEFLSHEAVSYLRDLGIEPARLGAVEIDEVAVSAGNEMVDCRLPFPAWSLSRRRLDEVLIRQAESEGAAVRRGLSVRRLERAGEGWMAQLADGTSLTGRNAFLATGKHELRGWKRGEGRQNDLIGLKIHFRLSAGQAARLARRIELFLFPGGYAGLELIEGGTANLCLLVRRSTFRQLGQEWQALLDAMREACPHMDERLAGSTALHGRPLAIAGIPYGLVQQPEDGCWRLGDQAAVIPSFAGEGMSIALHSASLAADHVLGGRTASEFHRRLSSDVSARVRAATMLSHLLVRGPAQAVLVRAVRVFPGALALLASATRLPARSLDKMPVAMAVHGTAS